MKPPLRLAVLECDVPLDNVVARHGSYGDIFTRLLARGARQLHTAKGADLNSQEPPRLDVACYNVYTRPEVYPRLEEVDALLLTGSRFNAYDDTPWIAKLVEFTRAVLAQRRVRVIGVCFGHQILGRALDVRVDRSDRGWEVAVVDVALTAKGREVLGLDSLRIHQMHRDIIYAYPPGADVEPLGTSPRCPTQGMYARRRFLSVQGHPEFTADIEEDILAARHAQGLFDKEMYEEALTRVRNRHDGEAVAAAFVRFLLEE